MSGEGQLDVALWFFRVMADETRLKILGTLANRESSVNELAASLALRPPTVSHHLAKLRKLGLLRMRAEGTTHLYSLDAEALRTLSRYVLSEGGLASLVDDVDAQAWERKVLKDFFQGERLKEIPASPKKRTVVLHWLAGRFASGTDYGEREVNEILGRHHHDFATLRRELVESGHLAREGGVYRRAEEH